MSFVALLLVLRDLEVSLTSGEIAEREVAGMELHARPVHLSMEVQTLQRIQKICRSSALCRLSFLWDEYERPSLRITVLSETESLSLPFLLDMFAEQPCLRIEACRYRVSEALLSHSPWAGLSSWADFLSPPYGWTTKFHLGTPLVLPKESSVAESVGYRFPVPCQLFTELARYWQELGGPPLPVSPPDFLPLLLDGSIVLADYRLHSCQVWLDGSIRLGFRGWISYQCRSSVEAVRMMLTALSRFASFVGVGAGTECGMGATWVAVG